MVSAMDDAIGAVLDKLRSAGLEENTLIFFISDNGGPTSVNASSNAPFRGVKGEVREGGIRSPFLIQWKARLPAGKVYRRPVIQLDFFPTVLAAAGAAPSAEANLDGVNLLPFLTGEHEGRPHDVLYWRFNFPARQPQKHKWAIRQGDWKLFTDIDLNRSERPVRPDHLMLVNLADDPGETTDLSSEHPKEAAALRAAWDEWNAQLAPPGGPDGPAEPRPRRRKAAE